MKRLTELCLTVFYIYFIILYNTTGMSHIKSRISPTLLLFYRHSVLLNSQQNNYVKVYTVLRTLLL